MSQRWPIVTFVLACLLNAPRSLKGDIPYFGVDPMEGENITLSNEKEVLRYLQRRYSLAGRGGRPVTNMSEPTMVEFGLGLIQMELDEKRKIFTTSMWSRLRWKDDYLTWNPGEYGGITAVRMEPAHVWIPDIMLYNTADPAAAARFALVVVLFDGTVQWVPHQIFKSSCSIDVANFPFDRQTCNMWFGSWTHAIAEIDVNLAFAGGIDLSTFQSDYKDSCEWDIIKPIAEKRLLPEDDPNPVAVLAFTLHMERKLTFSTYILTLPCVFLASLTLVVFWLPPDRPDRTSLAMSLFASFLVLLLILVEAAPPTASSIPTLGVYYCFNMVIIMMSIFLSTMVVNIHRGGENKRKVPKWLRCIAIDCFGRVFCIQASQRKAPPKYHKSDISDEEDVQKIIQFRSETETYTNKTSNHADLHIQANCSHPESPVYVDNHLSSALGSKLKALERNCSRLDTQLLDMKKTLEQMLNNTLQKDALVAECREIVREWKIVAQVLDRAFFLIYIISIIVSLVAFFPRPPWWENQE